MRKTKFTNTIDSISISGQCTAILLFIFLFGISTGVFFEVMMGTEMKSSMQSYLQNILQAPMSSDSTAIHSFISLLGSIISNSLAILLIAFAGFTRFAYPVSSVVILVKGMSLGYCCALMLETLAFKGVFVIALALFPQNTLLIPAIILTANAAISKSQSTHYKRNKGMIRSGFNSADVPYLYMSIFFCFLAVLGCIIQSFLLPIAARML